MSMVRAETKREMPRYRCHKEVHALKIEHVVATGDGGAQISFCEPGYESVCVDAAYKKRHEPMSGGYYVVYEDGYKSFSPAEAFEKGYTRI